MKVADSQNTKFNIKKIFLGDFMEFLKFFKEVTKHLARLILSFFLVIVGFLPYILLVLLFGTPAAGVPARNKLLTSIRFKESLLTFFYELHYFGSLLLSLLPSPIRNPINKFNNFLLNLSTLQKILLLLACPVAFILSAIIFIEPNPAVVALRILIIIFFFYLILFWITAAGAKRYKEEFGNPN